VHARGSEFQVNNLHVSCPLPGEHQVVNACTAVSALTQLGVEAQAITIGVAQTRWPGRLEHVSDQPAIVLDGAHNPAGARALAAYISNFFERQAVWIVYGAMRDKSVQEITEILFPLAAKVIVTAPSAPRALHPDVLRQNSDHPDVVLCPTATEAAAFARRAPPSTTVFVTGSLYLIGEVRPLFVK
jgi:dihydrofolate synthase/folylpolyglutamate synthase